MTTESRSKQPEYPGWVRFSSFRDVAPENQSRILVAPTKYHGETWMSDAWEAFYFSATTTEPAHVKSRDGGFYAQVEVLDKWAYWPSLRGRPQLLSDFPNVSFNRGPAGGSLVSLDRDITR